MKKRISLRGFTLIELLVVVAIIGILAAIAFPNYTQYVVRTNRSDAKVKLTEVMFEQERHQARKRTYATNLTTIGYSTNPVISDEGHYSISAAVCGGGVTIRNCVLLTATPVVGGIQAGNGEAALTLNSRGVKTGKWSR